MDYAAGAALAHTMKILRSTNPSPEVIKVIDQIESELAHIEKPWLKPTGAAAVKVDLAGQTGLRARRHLDPLIAIRALIVLCGVIAAVLIVLGIADIRNGESAGWFTVVWNCGNIAVVVWFLRNFGHVE